MMSFPVSINETSFPFELVFADVWVLYQFNQLKDQYYVAFVDSFREFTWIYTMKLRS